MKVKWFLVGEGLMFSLELVKVVCVLLFLEAALFL